MGGEAASNCCLRLRQAGRASVALPVPGEAVGVRGRGADMRLLGGCRGQLSDSCVAYASRPADQGDRACSGCMGLRTKLPGSGERERPRLRSRPPPLAAGDWRPALPGAHAAQLSRPAVLRAGLLAGESSAVVINCGWPLFAVNKAGSVTALGDGGDSAIPSCCLHTRSIAYHSQAGRHRKVKASHCGGMMLHVACAASSLPIQGTGLIW